MKYTITAIAVATLGMLIWAYRSGGAQFAAIMAAALMAISVCGMLPVLFAARSRHRENAAHPPSDTANRIIVKDDDPDSRTLP